MYRQLYPLIAIALFLLILTVALPGCSGGGGGGSGSGTASGASGTLKVGLTDKNSEEFQNLWIRIKEVRVVPAGRESAADNDPALPVVAQFPGGRDIDVLTLQFVQQALGEVVLPAGRYNQIRLILADNPNGNGQSPVNYVVLKSDPVTKIPLKTPSAQQSGLKIVGTVEVKPNVINAVLLDFDPNTAVVSTGAGTYILKPTGIRIVQLAGELNNFGSLVGTVAATFKDWSSAVVSVKRRGSINDSDPIAAGRIFSSYTSGSWQAPFNAFVPPTSPTVFYRTFVAANGFRLYSSPAVSVATGQATDLGSILLQKSP